MQKLLIPWALGASLLAGGCSTVKDVGDAIPDMLDKMPLMYHPDIQQGNVLTQESVNKLMPGMTKSQVRYLMGTPMLVDVFHQDRWDYIYTFKEGGGEMERKRISLFFENDRLLRMVGDMRPVPEMEQEVVEKEVVVDVPDNSGRKGLITRALEKVGVESEE